MIWAHKIAWDPKKAQVHRAARVARFAHNRAFNAGPKQHETAKVDRAPEPFDAAPQITTIHWGHGLRNGFARAEDYPAVKKKGSLDNFTLIRIAGAYCQTRLGAGALRR